MSSIGPRNRRERIERLEQKVGAFAKAVESSRHLDPAGDLFAQKQRELDDSVREIHTTLSELEVSPQGREQSEPELQAIISKFRRISSLLGTSYESRFATTPIEQLCDEFMVDGADLRDLAKVELGESICNTGLTEMLQRVAFGHDDEETYSKYELKMNQLLQKLSYLIDDEPVAKEALITPNDPGKEISAQSGGFPRNSPLVLLVKMGNLKGVKILLPALSKEHLFFSTPLGNNALHLAVMTGQMELALALMNRAEELGVLEQFLELRNRSGKTANDLLISLVNLPKTDAFKPYEDLAEIQLGGEEIHKARVNHHGLRLLDMRKKIFDSQPVLKGWQKDPRLTSLLSLYLSQNSP